MYYNDDQMLMLSGIQHYMFCPRQWALIHIEQQWSEKRLRRVAKECVNYGQRVQNSVFECLLTEAQLVNLKTLMSSIIDDTTDSIRFYHLGSNWKRKIETMGKETSFDPTDTLII